MFLVFRLSTKGVCSLNVQWAESLQCAEKSVGEVCQCGCRVFLGKSEEAAAHTSSPFTAELLCKTARNTFCILHCLLLLDCSSATKVTPTFAEEMEGGKRDSCTDFPSPPLLCKILWTGSLLTGPGKWWDLTQRCLLSTSLLLVQLFLVSQSLQQLVSDLSLCSALSLEASSSQCHEKRDCLLCAAPFAPTGSHQLPLSQHQRHPRLAREQILLWVSSKVLCSW